MTEEKLKAVARAVCEMRGLNPDETIVEIGEYGHETFSSQWREVAREIVAHAQIIAALRCAGVSP